MPRSAREAVTHNRLLSLVPQAPCWSVDWNAVWALWPDLPALDECPQDPIHHAEGDVGTHTRMVVEELVRDPDWRGMTPEDRALLFWTAILHDVGKPAVTRPETDGRISSHGHSRIGAGIARRLLYHAGSPFRWREAVCGLIGSHQLPFYLIERTDPERTAIETSWRCRADHLCLHARADLRGRICRDGQAVLDNIGLARIVFEEAGCASAPFVFANDESRVAFFEHADRDARYEAFENHRCTVTLMSGLPGAGKDSWISRNRPEHPVVSLDRIRQQSGVSATANQGAVVQAAHELARTHLRAHRDFVWNATNVSRQLRSKVVRLLRDYGARVEVVYIEPRYETLVAQNSGRKSSVPDPVVQRLIGRLEPPTLLEAHSVCYLVPD